MGTVVGKTICVSWCLISPAAATMGLTELANYVQREWLLISWSLLHFPGLPMDLLMGGMRGKIDQDWL